jgi:NAD(P)-dependent dehydrogenase (short-subunit alcohol dehydrogenase family)
MSAQKSIIVTGGASGIGLAITRHFAAQGHRVAMLDLNAASGPGVAASVAAEFPESTVSFHQCDVSSWDQQAAAFKEVFQEHGNSLDIVVANAGVSEQGVTTLVSLAEDGEGPRKPRTTTVEVNLLGTIYCEWVLVSVLCVEKKEQSEADLGSTNASGQPRGALHEQKGKNGRII